MEYLQMSFDPFLKAGLVVQIHMIAAIVSLVIGGVVFFNPKGTSKHKVLGKTWVILMVIIALTSFFISELKTWGPFSPIHLLSVLTLFTLAVSIKAIRRGDVKRHKSAMLGLYWGGLVLAGLFTLMPGRIINRMLFGNPEFYFSTLSLAWIFPFSAIVIAFGVMALRLRSK